MTRDRQKWNRCLVPVSFPSPTQHKPKMGSWGRPFIATTCYYVCHHFDKLGAKPQKETNDVFKHIKITSAKTLHCITVTLNSLRSLLEHAEIITFHNCMQMMIIYRLIKFWFGKQDAGRAWLLERGTSMQNYFSIAVSVWQIRYRKLQKSQHQILIFFTAIMKEIWFRCVWKCGANKNLRTQEMGSNTREWKFYWDLIMDGRIILKVILKGHMTWLQL